MFGDAIEYPLEGEEAVKNILIGGFVGAFGMFLLVPLVFTNGYLVRVLRRVGTHDTEVPPAFDDWGGLLTDGVVSFVIGFAYLSVPMAFAFLNFGLLLPAVDVAGGGAGDLLALFLVIVLLFGSFVVGLAAFYLLPAGIAAYAVTGEFRSAFSPSTLWTLGSDKRYLLGVVIAFVVNFIVQFLANVVILTIVGILLVPFMIFYANVASAYAIGLGVADTPLVAEPSDGETTAGQPAV